MHDKIDMRGVATTAACVAVMVITLTVAFSSILTRATDVACVGDCLLRHDLAAQSHMALAAWSMVLVTAISLGVGVVSLVFLRANLIETRRIGEAQTRAYLSVSEATVERTAAVEWWKLKFKFRNSGQTPAVNLITETVVWTEAKVGDHWRKTPLEPIAEKRPRSDTASQGEKNAVCTVNIINLLRPQGQAGQTRLRASIEIRYKDIFGSDQHTYASYYIDISAYTNLPFDAAKPLMRSIHDFT